METIKDEQQIRKFDIKAWYSDQILNIPFSVSHPITLSFTNKRVHYSSSIEMLNYSYENIAGIEVLKTLLPVRRKYVITPVIVYFALGMIGVGLKVTWLVPYFVSLLVIIPLVAIIGRTRVYKVSLISQNSGVLCGFFIDRDEKLIHEIQQTFEHGKQNTVKSAFTAQGQANNDKQVKTLEDLKKAKELLDLGAISQEEFNEIKRQALGTLPKQELARQPEPIATINQPAKIPIIQRAYNPIKASSFIEETTPQKVKSPLNKRHVIIACVSTILFTLCFFLYRHFIVQPEEDIYNKKYDSRNRSSQPTPESVDNSTTQFGNEEALADSYYMGFLSTPTGERYKKIKIQVPNNDEAGTTSEIEVISPVEGLYVSNKEGKTRSIKISYDGEKIYALHWVDTEQAVKEEAYITSKGYFAFGSEEFEYDRYGETVTEVENLSLVERFTGQVFVRNTQ